MPTLYDNYKCISKEGEHLFFCNKKKAHNYLKKGIAKIISEDPFVFQLLFEPNGKGVPNQKPRENKCLGCDSSENLTRHHIIPYVFRKHMPLEMKEHKSEDVAPLCEDCHREYEVSSRELTLKLLENCKDEIVERSLAIKAKKGSNALHNYYDKLSDEKKLEYTNLLKYLSVKIKSDYELIVSKYSAETICKLWKEDFQKWLVKKGKENVKWAK